MRKVRIRWKRALHPFDARFLARMGWHLLKGDSVLVGLRCINIGLDLTPLASSGRGVFLGRVHIQMGVPALIVPCDPEDVEVDPILPV